MLGEPVTGNLNIVWSGRRHLISSEGSNVSGIKDDTFATTTGLPINPTVGTEALANTSIGASSRNSYRPNYE
jgi:hypothetical protein